MKTLLAKTVIANIRNRAMNQIANYSITCTDPSGLNRWYTVTNRFDASRAYKVDTFENKCNCPAFKTDRFCKHFAMTQATRADEARYEAEAAKLNDPDFIGFTA